MSMMHYLPCQPTLPPCTATCTALLVTICIGQLARRSEWKPSGARAPVSALRLGLSTQASADILARNCCITPSALALDAAAGSLAICAGCPPETAASHLLQLRYYTACSEHLASGSLPSSQHIHLQRAFHQEVRQGIRDA